MKTIFYIMGAIFGAYFTFYASILRWIKIGRLNTKKGRRLLKSAILSFILGLICTIIAMNYPSVEETHIRIKRSDKFIGDKDTSMIEFSISSSSNIMSEEQIHGQIIEPIFELIYSQSYNCGAIKKACIEIL